ncbi:unnamed protein product [Ilex paraguariensis]|uniref:Uncharacterized protein n=1 Tax=Ilex paraguariensis TaxID=185542 RepID=A0ABC8UHA9_9AQUA
MVAGFRRSLSFPNHSSKPHKNLHVRSTSLPCRSHPLISQLQDEINELKNWHSDPDNGTSAWLCDGLNRLKIVHEGFDDLLQLPQPRESLCRHSEWTEKLLEDFLGFVDVYGVFQSLVLTLKQEHLAAQVALRRKDHSKVALYVKAIKKIAKATSKLMTTVRSYVGGRFFISESVSLTDVDAELAEVLGNVNEVTVLVSSTLFNVISLWFASQKPSLIGLRFLKRRGKKVQKEEGIGEFQQVGLMESLWGGLRKKGEKEVKMVLKRMHELEDCICEIENGSERVFRSLIHSRVSLLNVLTQ